MKLFIVFFLCFALAYADNLRLPQCRRSDPEIEKCILDKIEAVKQMLKEPFKIATLEASTSNGAAVDVKATLQNIETRRWTNFRIENLKVNLHDKNNFTGDIEVVVPRLDMSADYNMQGMVFGLNFKSYGKFKGSFNSITIKSKYVASSITRGGVEYLQLDSVTKKVSIGGGNLKLKPADNSFIGRQIASFAYSDPVDALRLLTPAIEDNASRVVKKQVNKLLAFIPLKVVLVD